MNDRKREQIALLALAHQREMQELMGSDLVAARESFLDLYAWTPEYIDDKVMKAYEDNGAQKGEVPPFFSEVCLYELLGKDHARSLRGYLHHLGEALGLNWTDMRKAMNESDLSEEEVAEKEKPTADAPLTEADFDALQIQLMDRMRYEMGDDLVKSRRMLRALKATREVHAVPQDPNLKFMRVKPENLRIGDQICRRGEWNEVLGFFHHEEDKRWTDEGMAFSETPVGSKELDYRDKPKEYFVKTSWSPRCGDCLKGAEEILIRRTVEPTPEPAPKKAEEAT
jgi:hypothetical protein